MRLTLTVSAEEYDAAVLQHRHVTSITHLVIEQEGGLLATTQKVVSIAEVGIRNAESFGKDKPVVAIWTAPEDPPDEAATARKRTGGKK